MSAKNWQICPECERLAQQKSARALTKANASYGKVSAEEYRVLCIKADAQPKLEETLREDYQQGIHNGQYSVSYRGHCQECGFMFDYEYKCEAKNQAKKEEL